MSMWFKTEHAIAVPAIRWKHIISYLFVLLLLTLFFTSQKNYLIFPIISLIVILSSLFLLYLFLKFGFYTEIAKTTGKTSYYVIDQVFPLQKLRSTRSLHEGKLRHFVSKVFLQAPQDRADASYINDLVTEITQKMPQNSHASFLHLGGAGCSLPLFFAAKYPKTSHTVIEINKTLIAVAKKYFFPLFGKKSYDNLSLVHDDALKFIEKTSQKYDFVIQDIFSGHIVPPIFLSEAWLLQLLRRTIKPGGFLIINVGSLLAVDMVHLINNTVWKEKYNLRVVMIQKKPSVLLVFEKD